MKDASKRWFAFYKLEKRFKNVFFSFCKLENASRTCFLFFKLEKRAFDFLNMKKALKKHVVSFCKVGICFKNLFLFCKLETRFKNVTFFNMKHVSKRAFDFIKDHHMHLSPF